MYWMYRRREALRKPGRAIYMAEVLFRPLHNCEMHWGFFTSTHDLQTWKWKHCNQ